MARVRTVGKVADPNEPMNDKFESMRLADSKLVKGIFQDNEVKGGQISFPFKKWKGDSVKEYTLIDGQEYELPLGVVKHLNSGCAYQSHSWLLGPDGKHIKNSRKTHRFSFKVLEYT
jgi:hypothetical protein